VMAMLTAEGEIAFRTTDHSMRPETDQPGRYRSVAIIPPNLLNRRNYVVLVSFEIPGVRFALEPRDYLSFTVAGVGNHGSHFPEPWDGGVCPIVDWELQPVAGPGERTFADPSLTIGQDLRADRLS